MTRRLLLALVSGQLVSPIDYGAECDVRGVNDAAVAGGSLSTVTSATAAFTSGDTGKTYALASTGGAVTTGTLTYVNSTTATMSTAAGGAMSGARLIFFTNDHDAWQAALDAATPGQTVDIVDPTWRSGIMGQLVVPTSVHLGIIGRGPFDPLTNPAMNDHGPTLVLIQDSDPAILLDGFGSGVGDFIFYTANQTHAHGATPQSHGAVIAISEFMGGCRIGSPYIANATTGISLKGGRHHIDRPQLGVLGDGLVLDYCRDRIHIAALNLAPYYRLCEGETWTPTAGSLDEYALSNAWAVRALSADSWHIDNLVTYGVYGGLLVDDSPDTGQSPRSGYGTVTQMDIDYCALGVAVKSVPSGTAVLISSAVIGANGSGVGASGVSAVATLASGISTPELVVSSWSHRGTWSGGASANGAGTLIVPATNPG